jgi:hypothetical protein
MRNSRRMIDGKKDREPGGMDTLQHHTHINMHTHTHTCICICICKYADTRTRTYGTHMIMYKQMRAQIMPTHPPPTPTHTPHNTHLDGNALSEHMRAEVPSRVCTI